MADTAVYTRVRQCTVCAYLLFQLLPSIAEGVYDIYKFFFWGGGRGLTCLMILTFDAPKCIRSRHVAFLQPPVGVLYYRRQRRRGPDPNI